MWQKKLYKIRCVWIGSVIINIIIIIFASNSCAASVPKEYQIKAVFLYNLANFVRWPATVFNGQEPFQICILGNDPFGEVLDYTVESQEARGQPFKVKRFSKAARLESCHIVFISQSEEDHLHNILDMLTPNPILTVSDIDDFSRKGGMIEFFKYKNKIRLSINIDILEEAKLKADANLLKLSKIIHSKD